MKPNYKKAILSIIAAVCLTLSACSFSVGNNEKSEDYKDIFVDRDIPSTGAYKNSDVAYDFTLGEDYGSMKIYADTSEGHSFELMKDSPAGFKINDKDGNTALYGICMDKAQYAEYSARCTEVMTINGREFLYIKNDDGSEDCYTYMADCGLDCGLVLEIHDNNYDNFRLVAFRGKALEGASSDVHHYQGTLPEVTEPAVTEAPETEAVSTETEAVSDIVPDDGAPEESTAAEGLTSSTVDGDIEALLQSLDTDYGKVLWGVRYSLFDDMPGIVASVTPYSNYSDNYLVVAITNLYDKSFSFAAAAEAAGADDTAVGDTFIFDSCIGPGSTIIETIYCGSSVPDGRIHWSDMSLTDPYGEYVPWEADYTASAKDGECTVNYSIYAADKETACGGTLVSVLLLDESGFVVGHGVDFIEDIPAGGMTNGTVDIFGSDIALASVKGAAVFANPVKSTE